MNRTCPSRERLQRLLDQPDSTAGWQLINEHLNSCPQCQTILEELTSATWLELPGHATAPDARLNELIEKMIRQLPAAGGEMMETAPPRFPGAADDTAPLGRLRDYRILARIAEGSQGILYLAFDELLRRRVAIKVLRHGLLQTGTAATRFEREARLAASLNDERIVRVYQIGHEPNFPPYIVMEFVEGDTLRQLLERQRPGVEDSVRWVRDAALGLEVAHRAGLIHRDIKPSNLLLDSKTGVTRLTDFGLALEQADANRMTQDGALAGTPAYMSPEQLSRPAEIDHRTDIYSLGVVLYELLAGEVPFRGTLRMTLLQVAHDEPRSPRHLNDQIPRDLETIVLKAMARDRNSRFASAREFADELERWQRGVPILSRPTGQLERFWRWCCRSPGVAALSTSTLVLLLTLAVVMGVSAARLAQSARIAEQQAQSATQQRDAAMEVLSQLVFKLQEQFEHENIVVDDLQQNSLQIALDGLTRLRQLTDDERLPARLTAEAFRRMGDILTRVYKMDEARECLIRAEAGFRELQLQPENGAAALHGLIETLWSRHDLELDAETPGTLLPWLVQATEAARTLFEVAPSSETRLLLGQALFHEAREHFDESALDQPDGTVVSKISELQNLIEPLLEMNSQNRVDSISLWLQASALLAQYQASTGQQRQAFVTLTNALPRLEDGRADEAPMSALAKLELVYRFRLRTLLLENADPEAAENQLQIISLRLNQLQETVLTNSIQFLQGLRFLDDLAWDLKEDQDVEGALFFVQKALELIQARLTKIPGDEVALLAQAKSLMELAEAADAADQPRKVVRRAYRNSLEQYRELSNRASFDEEHWFSFCITLLSAAEYEQSLGSNRRGELVAEAKRVRDQLKHYFPLVSAEWLPQIDQRLAKLADDKE